MNKHAKKVMVGMILGGIGLGVLWMLGWTTMFWLDLATIVAEVCLVAYFWARTGSLEEGCWQTVTLPLRAGESFGRWYRNRKRVKTVTETEVDYEDLPLDIKAMLDRGDYAVVKLPEEVI